MSKLKTAYALNQKIVYPSQGVGKIVDIKEKAFKEQMLLYYVIYLEASDMTVMIPVERCDELGIRSIVDAKKAQETLDSLGDDFEPITNDWKLRYQMNLDLLKKGSVDDIATIVRCLYHRSKIKELPILERKLYDSAKKLLEDEISFALEKTAKEVESLIHTKLEPLGMQQAKPVTASPKNDEDDEDEDVFDVNDDEDVDDDDDDED
ncbi:MAG TPA: CarD family transcriptional regulator [Treponemataceae bacterium]|mgnify:FL=1|nr:CarD family transcriptional regulator [Treponemataceae bacterium]HPM05518.1 CarD family transcriptional regulator [Treponemataceae bacterium]